MAVIKLGSTGSASRLISYAEKRAVEKEGVDCNPEYAKTQFKVTRELYGKADGVQAHHVIQSFAPGEIEPGMANQIGRDLAKEIAKGHECVVYTHADKGHIHNHIVINAVGHEDGKKYQSKKSDLYKIREKSDELCKERGLSIVKEPTARERYTMAEKSVIEKGGVSWKDELRQIIDYEKAHAKSYADFKQNLTVNHGVEINDKGKHITYKHPDHAKVVRGNKLGLDYERSTIENGFSRQIERVEERGIDNTSSSRKVERTEPTIKGRVGEFSPEGAFGGISNIITAIEEGTRQLAPKLREDEPSSRGEGESATELEPNVEPKREEPVREVKRPRFESDWELDR